MNFKVGQKVVCIHGTGRLTKGKVYTVDGLGRLPNTITIAEEKSLYDTGLDGWFSWHFRLAVEPRTDISIFTRMLTDVKEPA